MNFPHQIAEARASALSLRASANACGPEHGALRFRLVRAAESLDAVVMVAVRDIVRIEELEQELRKLRTTKPEKLCALAPAEEADVGDALREVHSRLEHARERIAEGMRVVDRFDHAIIINVLVLLAHHAAVELTDAHIQCDSTRERTADAMSRQIARVRAKLDTMLVSP